MGSTSPFFHELKKQASSFIKDKIKTARLALTDVTPAQLMTEDATNGNTWPPDTRAIGVISRAAFEVDDYWRIVEILHSRLLNFDRNNWRGPYKALILLEHLLTHGPLRVSEEFKDDIDVIKEMGNFQYIDEKGFNWGLRVNKLCDRVLKLIKNSVFLDEERARARNLTRGIEGFGSFIQRSSAIDKGFPSKAYGRCNSYYDDHLNEENRLTQESGKERNSQFVKEEEVSESWLSTGDGNPRGNHPFCDHEHQIKSLLSSGI
ncbi:hypothetical protein L484_010750 [Morus notabilis]|uniref:ENTH domain-containing protein n=2 Tax=Morus notabilis TaxID=981085 RepID=W9S768_9ROSA|nr:hypothetical protein L484_010750 [Morus notabilis]